MKDWWKKQGNARWYVGIMVSVIGSAVGIAQLLSPLVDYTIKADKRLSIIENNSTRNTEDISKILEYKEDSEAARIEVVAGFGVMQLQIGQILEFQAKQDKRNIKMDRRIEKFYEMNKGIKRPPVAIIQPLTPHYIHEYDLLNQGGSN